MAHNQVAVLGTVSLHNPAPASVEAEVVVEVRDGEGLLSRPCRALVDLAAQGTTTLTGLDLVLDPAAMLHLDERRPGDVIVRVERDGEPLCEERRPVALLAARQWVSRPLELALEMLAAYVTPNDPAVTTLLGEAAALLEKRTGSPSIEGYQSGPERVDEIVRALCDAMLDRGIRYSEPPASWADEGQKIRTPTEVFEGRVGTCLDTTVALAAAMEQSGIRPLLWIVTGHAFLGYWREEHALDATARTDVSDIVNYIDLGLIRLIETTMLTAGPERPSFESLHQPPYSSFLTGDLSDVFGVVDVWAARHNNIVPLPARRTTPDGTVQIIEYHAAHHSAPRDAQRGNTSARETSRTSAGPEVPARVQHWKNVLLDLSLRNRLINYSDRAGVHVTVPDGKLAAIEDLVNARKPLTLLPADAIDRIHVERGARTGADLPTPLLFDLLARSAVFTDVPESSYSTRLRGLAYKAKTIVEETGANNLYLALGSLVWSVDGKDLRSPLVLVPVRLVAGRGHAYRLELDESGTSTPNYCLLEKLRQVHQLEVPGLAEPEEDDAGIDLDAALHAMRVALAEHGLPYRVEPSADLSILQFAKFRLWKDLDEHWQSLVANPLVRHLVESPTEPFDDPVPEPEDIDLDELDASCPVAADASQLEAIGEAVAGRTFVLEGPPGTGKSQTITNLLSRAVADGRRVLFVAEKRAALDVVRARLDAVGMGPFSLDLHDKGSKPALVRAQIKAALDHAVSVDAQGLAAENEDLRSSRRALSRYKERLHAHNGAGFSFYSARDSLLALSAVEECLPVPPTLLDETAATAVSEIRRALKDLPNAADPARPSADHPWGFVGLTDPESLDAEAIRAAVAAVDTALAALPTAGPLTQVLSTVRTADDMSTLATLVNAPLVPVSVLDETRTASWQTASSALIRELDGFVATAHPGLDVAAPAALGLPLADLNAQAEAAAASGFFGRKKRLAAVLAQLSPTLRQGVVVPPKRLPELTAALLRVQGEARALASRAESVPGIRLPDSWNPLIPDDCEFVKRQIGWLGWAGRAIDVAGSATTTDPFATALREYVASAQPADPSAVAAVGAAANALHALGQCCSADQSTMSVWAGSAGLHGRWSATQERRLADPSLVNLRRWVTFVAALEPLRSAGLVEARQLLLRGQVHADDAVRAFERGLALASLDERRQSTGLDAFDALTHDRAITRFARAARAMRHQMSSVLPRQVLDARPFDAANGRGRVGALQRELAKQRRGLGVRALLSTYGDLITALMPCVLVSPDSVARFFPVGSQVFDIVVFDEASQIRVADAVGAMGRARSVVVVGDSKQMPPSSFAEAGTGLDDDATADESLAVEDQESILTESVLARVPRRWLSWHYRSRDESLIAFSNHHYYENKLSSFPAPTNGEADGGVEGYGISLVRVDGKFQRSGKGKLLRTNPIEAEAIVAEICRRFDSSPHAIPSLGVVTFNQQQRAYIEGLLRDRGDERLIEALDNTKHEGLFVKNLENVQGDERDVILFSTAFSVNDKGVLPLNFGPLTRGGGEKRLNVAITRARRQVVIFSSFEPAQLRADETQSLGIKHLRAYLELAARGTQALTSRTSTATTDRHRDEIADRLSARGLVVRTDVGLSDFKIDLSVALPDNPEKPVMAVLLDGVGWAGRRTVGDRDGLPVEVLSGLLRWPVVERVWLPAWLADSDSILDRLEARAREAAAAVRSPSAPEPTASPDEHSPSDTAADHNPLVQRIASAPSQTSAGSPARHPDSATSTQLPGERPFVAWDIPALGSREVLDALPGRSAATLVRDALEQAVVVEGPIHLERLARLVAAAFGLTRVNAARMSSILDQLPRRLRGDRSEPFAWPETIKPDEWTEFRRASEDDPRPLEQISLREISNAMVALCSASAGMNHDELVREALAVFGGRRRTAKISDRLEEALSVALSAGRLRESTGMYVVADA